MAPQDVRRDLDAVKVQVATLRELAAQTMGVAEMGAKVPAALRSDGSRIDGKLMPSTDAIAGEVEKMLAAVTQEIRTHAAKMLHDADVIEKEAGLQKANQDEHAAKMRQSGPK